MSEAKAALQLVEAEDVGEGWSVQSVQDADWALSRLGELEREQQENQAIATAAMEKILLRTQTLNERLQKRKEYFQALLTAYAQAHRAELLGGGKKKSRSLLHGSIGWRKSGGSLEVKDKEALLEWARKQPVESGALRIKEEAALDEIKRRFKVSGELPDGCEVSPETETVVIKTATLGDIDE